MHPSRSWPSSPSSGTSIRGPVPLWGGPRRRRRRAAVRSGTLPLAAANRRHPDSDCGTSAPRRSRGRTGRPSAHARCAWRLMRERQRSPQTMVCRRRPSSEMPQPRRRVRWAGGRWRCGGPRTRPLDGHGRIGPPARAAPAAMAGWGNERPQLRRAHPRHESRGHPSRPASHRATGFRYQFGVIRRNSAARVTCGVGPRAPMSTPCGYRWSAPGSTLGSVPPLGESVQGDRLGNQGPPAWPLLDLS